MNLGVDVCIVKSRDLYDFVFWNDFFLYESVEIVVLICC